MTTGLKYAFNLYSKIFKKYHMFRLIPFLRDDHISKNYFVKNKIYINKYISMFYLNSKIFKKCHMFGLISFLRDDHISKNCQKKKRKPKTTGSYGGNFYPSKDFIKFENENNRLGSHIFRVKCTLRRIIKPWSL